jgi:hypothetical protein
MTALLAGLLAFQATFAFAQPVTVPPSDNIVVNQYYDGDKAPTPGVSVWVVLFVICPSFTWHFRDRTLVCHLNRILATSSLPAHPEHGSQPFTRYAGASRVAGPIHGSHDYWVNSWYDSRRAGSFPVPWPPPHGQLHAISTHQDGRHDGDASLQGINSAGCMCFARMGSVKLVPHRS